MFRKVLIAFVGMSYSVTCFAQNDATDQIELKFTPALYRMSDGNSASDMNLRAALGNHTAWVGFYEDRYGYRQLRTGYENRQEFGFTRWVFSTQIASRGFLGGSVSSEIGNDTFAIVGFGRTNLRDYYNLNFDPNDAITLGVGTRSFEKSELSLFQTFDDRLGTHQRITHFVSRVHWSSTERISIDVSHKSGLTSSQREVKGNGLTVTYDFGKYFARIGYDQYANFTDSHATRAAFGFRF